MPKYGYVDQAVQGANIYRQAKQQGNQQMMQNGLQMIAQATNALRGVTDVQQTRQTMELQRTAEGRAQQLFPLQKQAQQQAVQAGQIDIAKQQRQEEEYSRITAQSGRSPGELELLAKMKQWGVDAAEAEQTLGRIAAEQKLGLTAEKTAAQVAEERRRQAEAVTGERMAVAQRPYVGQVAAAEGAEATLRQAVSESDLRTLPQAEITKRFQLQSEAVKAQMQRGLDFYDLGRIVQIKNDQKRLLDAQIQRLIDAGLLDQATALQRIAAAEQVDTESLNRSVALADDIRQTYMALASLERGTVDWSMIAAIKSFNLGVPKDTATLDLIKKRLSQHIEILQSAMNQYGYEYDNTSEPAVIRKMGAAAMGTLPTGGMTTTGRTEQLRRAAYKEGDISKGLKSAWEEPSKKKVGPLGPPAPAGAGEESDIDAIMRALE